MLGDRKYYAENENHKFISDKSVLEFSVCFVCAKRTAQFMTYYYFQNTCINSCRAGGAQCTQRQTDGFIYARKVMTQTTMNERTTVTYSHQCVLCTYLCLAAILAIAIAIDRRDFYCCCFFLCKYGFGFWAGFLDMATQFLRFNESIKVFGVGAGTEAVLHTQTHTYHDEIDMFKSITKPYKMRQRPTSEDRLIGCTS